MNEKQKLEEPLTSTPVSAKATTPEPTNGSPAPKKWKAILVVALVLVTGLGSYLLTSGGLFQGLLRPMEGDQPLQSVSSISVDKPLYSTEAYSTEAGSNEITEHLVAGEEYKFTNNSEENPVLFAYKKDQGTATIAHLPENPMDNIAENLFASVAYAAGCNPEGIEAVLKSVIGEKMNTLVEDNPDTSVIELYKEFRDSEEGNNEKLKEAILDKTDCVMLDDWSPGAPKGVTIPHHGATEIKDSVVIAGSYSGGTIDANSMYHPAPGTYGTDVIVTLVPDDDGDQNMIEYYIEFYCPTGEEYEEDGECLGMTRFNLPALEGGSRSVTLNTAEYNALDTAGLTRVKRIKTNNYRTIELKAITQFPHILLSDFPKLEEVYIGSSATPVTVNRDVYTHYTMGKLINGDPNELMEITIDYVQGGEVVPRTYMVNKKEGEALVDWGLINISSLTVIDGTVTSLSVTYTEKEEYSEDVVPVELINLTYLYAPLVLEIPKEFTKLEELHASLVKKIPEDLVNLKEIEANSLLEISAEFDQLEFLRADSLTMVPAEFTKLESLYGNSLKTVPKEFTQLKTLYGDLLTVVPEEFTKLETLLGVSLKSIPIELGKSGVLEYLWAPLVTIKLDDFPKLKKVSIVKADSQSGRKDVDVDTDLYTHYEMGKLVDNSDDEEPPEPPTEPGNFPTNPVGGAILADYDNLEFKLLEPGQTLSFTADADLEELYLVEVTNASYKTVFNDDADAEITEAKLSQLNVADSGILNIVDNQFACVEEGLSFGNFKAVSITKLTAAGDNPEKIETAISEVSDDLNDKQKSLESLKKAGYGCDFDVVINKEERDLEVGESFNFEGEYDAKNIATALYHGTLLAGKTGYTASTVGMDWVIVDRSVDSKHKVDVYIIDITAAGEEPPGDKCIFGGEPMKESIQGLDDAFKVIIKCEKDEECYKDLKAVIKVEFEKAKTFMEENECDGLTMTSKTLNLEKDESKNMSGLIAHSPSNHSNTVVQTSKAEDDDHLAIMYTGENEGEDLLLTTKGTMKSAKDYDLKVDLYTITVGEEPPSECPIEEYDPAIKIALKAFIERPDTTAEDVVEAVKEFNGRVVEKNCPTIEIEPRAIQTQEYSLLSSLNVQPGAYYGPVVGEITTSPTRKYIPESNYIGTDVFLSVKSMPSLTSIEDGEVTIFPVKAVLYVLEITEDEGCTNTQVLIGEECQNIATCTLPEILNIATNTCYTVVIPPCQSGEVRINEICETRLTCNATTEDYDAATNSCNCKAGYTATTDGTCVTTTILPCPAGQVMINESCVGITVCNTTTEDYDATTNTCNCKSGYTKNVSNGICYQPSGGVVLIPRRSRTVSVGNRTAAGSASSSYTANKETVEDAFTCLEYDTSKKIVFTDLSSIHWAYMSVGNQTQYTTEDGDEEKRVIEGYIENGKNVFKPRQFMTRAEFLKTALIATCNIEKNLPALTFEDVYSNLWYIDVIKSAVDKGITSGYSATSFKPNISITREEAAIFSVRVYLYILNEASGLKLTVEDLAKDLSNPYVDVKKMDKSYDYFLVAYDLGLMKGEVETVGTTTKRSFYAADFLSRAEAVQVVDNLQNSLLKD